MAVGAGDLVIDFAFPEPDPAPFTTIGWRLAHVIVGVFGARNADHFGGPAMDYPTFDYAPDAATAWPSSTRATGAGSPASGRSAPTGWPGRAARPRTTGRTSRWRRWCCTSTAR